MARPFLPDSGPIARSSYLIIGSTPSTLTMSLVMSLFYCSNCLGNVLEYDVVWETLLQSMGKHMTNKDDSSEMKVRMSRDDHV